MQGLFEDESTIMHDPDLLEDDPIYAEIYNSQILAHEHEKEGAL